MHIFGVEICFVVCNTVIHFLAAIYILNKGHSWEVCGVYVKGMGVKGREDCLPECGTTLCF